jgi:hypothetical protein
MDFMTTINWTNSRQQSTIAVLAKQAIAAGPDRRSP